MVLVLSQCSKQKWKHYCIISFRSNYLLVVLLLLLLLSTTSIVTIHATKSPNNKMNTNRQRRRPLSSLSSSNKNDDISKNNNEPKAFSLNKNKPFENDLQQQQKEQKQEEELQQYTTMKNENNNNNKKPSKDEKIPPHNNNEEAINEETTTSTAMKKIWQEMVLSLEEDSKIRRRENLRTQVLLRQSWQRSFDEIRSIMAYPNKPMTTLTTKKKKSRRFDGGWDKRLQQWKDDISIYLSSPTATTVDDIINPTLPTSTPTSSTTTAEQQQQHQRGRRSNNDDDDVRVGVGYNLAITPSPCDPMEDIVPHANLSDPTKKITIVTTASLPWMTGTAVNPLLRAAYFTSTRDKSLGGRITLLLPWLERPSDQKRVFGSIRFTSPKEQEYYVRDWLKNVAEINNNVVDDEEVFRIRWYPAWQNKAENSIYSMGDITALIPVEEADIVILEEPEHLNWYRAPGESWTTKFPHVVGIVHTNYFVYAQEQPAALIRAPAMKLLCSWMCRAHCHRVIKLSGTLGSFAPEKELIENVNGVRRQFLTIGESLKNNNNATMLSEIFGPDTTNPKIYFIGKMLWSKGLNSLMELLQYAEYNAGLKNLTVDMYGGGPDKDEAQRRSKAFNLSMPFHGPIDHAALATTHKIFVNPSTSEVLCTTVAEALAMGKFVVLPSHPSNDFFEQFPNCLPYATKEEFVGNLYYAMTHSPEPLSEKNAHALSWEAATERLVLAGSISVSEANATAHALSSADLEISLPPLIERPQLTKLTATLRQTRDRYRRFRSRLSQEIQTSNVLPTSLTNILVSELDKRLDLDLDDILLNENSPKLRVKLSPAELDKRCLDIYKQVAKGPGGDVFRVIGGGADVGWQESYMWRQKWKERRQEWEERQRTSMMLLKRPSTRQHHRTMTTATATAVEGTTTDGGSDNVDETDLMPADQVSRALKKYLPMGIRSRSSSSTGDDTTLSPTTMVSPPPHHHPDQGRRPRGQQQQKDTPTMSLLSRPSHNWGTTTTTTTFWHRSRQLPSIPRVNNSLQPRICTTWLRTKVR